MSQVAQQQQFTPHLAFDADDHGEADGTVGVATDFYRRPNNYYLAPSDEEPRLQPEPEPQVDNVVVRMAPNVYRPPIWHSIPEHQIEPRPAPRVMRRPRHPAPRNYYRTGQVITRLFTGLGWLAIAVGLAVALVSFVPEFPAHYGLFSILIGAFGALCLGLLTVAIGHVARALFDQANAARDLVAIQRARLLSEQF